MNYQEILNTARPLLGDLCHACPVCNGKLYYSQDKQELICKLDSLAFPLRDGIPVLLENEARSLVAEESKP